MRLKLLKEKIYLTDVIRDIFSKADKSVNTSITVDVNGGITLENASELKDTGIAGLSVVSAIMGADNPKKASEKLLNIFNS